MSFNSNDYNSLLKACSGLEKNIIKKVFGSSTWGGSCYGMSVSAILSKLGIINAEEVQSNKKTLYEITKINNDDVESFMAPD